MVPAPAAIVVVPVTVNAPVWETAALAVDESAPLTVVVPNDNCAELVVNEPPAATVPETVRLPLVVSEVALVLVNTNAPAPVLALVNVTSPLVVPPTIVMLMPLKLSAALCVKLYVTGVPLTLTIGLAVLTVMVPPMLLTWPPRLITVVPVWRLPAV